MPVGGQDDVQRLVKVTRADGDSFAHADLGPVRFVPLVGLHGWSEEDGSYPVGL
jgi:protein-L-isoaspartate O-methyltransferase